MKSFLWTLAYTDHPIRIWWYRVSLSHCIQHPCILNLLQGNGTLTYSKWSCIYLYIGILLWHCDYHWHTSSKGLIENIWVLLNCIFCSVRFKKFGWNFRGAVWNFMKIFKPMYCQICMLWNLILVCDLRYLWSHNPLSLAISLMKMCFTAISFLVNDPSQILLMPLQYSGGGISTINIRIWMRACLIDVNVPNKTNIYITLSQKAQSKYHHGILSTNIIEPMVENETWISYDIHIKQWDIPLFALTLVWLDPIEFRAWLSNFTQQKNVIILPSHTDQICY